MALETRRQRRSANLAKILEFARLPAMVAGSVPAKRPGTAAFPPRTFMDPGSLESGWWSRGESNP